MSSAKDRTYSYIVARWLLASEILCEVSQATMDPNSSTDPYLVAWTGREMRNRAIKLAQFASVDGGKQEPEKARMLALADELDWFSETQGWYPDAPWRSAEVRHIAENDPPINPRAELAEQLRRTGNMVFSYVAEGGSFPTITDGFTLTTGMLHSAADRLAAGK